MSRRLARIGLSPSMLWIAVCVSLALPACNDKPATPAEAAPAAEPTVNLPKVDPATVDADPTPVTPAPKSPAASAAAASAAMAAGKLAARPGQPATGTAPAVAAAPAVPGAPGTPASAGAAAKPALPVSAIAPPQPARPVEDDHRGRLVTAPEKGSPDWVVQQVLRAAMNPDAEAGWRIIEPLMHSMHRTPNGMQSYRAFNYPASRRKVRLFLEDDKKPHFHVVKVETPDPDVLKIFVYNEKSMPTPCAVKKDVEAGGQWRIYRCSL